MCDPLTAVAVASAGLQYQTAKAQQKAQFVAQKRQNEIARANALIAKERQQAKDILASKDEEITPKMKEQAQQDLSQTVDEKSARLGLGKDDYGFFDKVTDTLKKGLVSLEDSS